MQFSLMSPSIFFAAVFLPPPIQDPVKPAVDCYAAPVSKFRMVIQFFPFIMVPLSQSVTPIYFS
jgi:hypothetical protein